MELLDIRAVDGGHLRVSLAHMGGVEELEGTPEQVDALGAALQDAAALAAVSTGWCPVADVVVGERMVRVGLTGAGRVTVITGPNR